MIRNRTPHILLAEDNPADVVLIRKCLKESASFEFELHVVQDGEAALRFLSRNAGDAKAPTPDLVILDLNMPKIGGIEVLQRIKSDSALKVTPIIVLSSSDSKEDIEASYQNYANCYVQKPRDLAGLMKVCKRIDDFWLKVVEYPVRDAR